MFVYILLRSYRIVIRCLWNADMTPLKGQNSKINSSRAGSLFLAPFFSPASPARDCSSSALAYQVSLLAGYISVNKRINSLLCNKEVFYNAAPLYNHALKHSNFDFGLHYESPPTHHNTSTRQNRQRNVIWFNPPYSKNVNYQHCTRLSTTPWQTFSSQSQTLQYFQQTYRTY